MPMTPATCARACSSWTRRHQTALQTVFAACVAVAVVADLVMVLGLGVDSITQRTWAACAAHPVIAVAGGLATVAVCWLVRGDWRAVMFAGMLGGHLFSVL